MAFRSPLRTIVPAGAVKTRLPALPPLRFEVAPDVAAPPLVVTAPTLMLPVVAVSVTADALLPTPRELLAPVVTMFCRAIPLAAVTVRPPEAVPVSVFAVVVMSAPEMAVTAPEVAVRVTLPPLVTKGSFSVIELPVMLTVPLAWPPAPGVPLSTLPLAESNVRAPVLLFPSVIAPPATTEENVAAPLIAAIEIAPVPSAARLMLPPALTEPV